MVPDHTPYIAGLIEASYDTTHHYPEVVVGYFTDTQNIHDPGILLERRYPAIYSPILMKQVTITSILFALSFQPETNAKVTVQGPLGTPKNRTVKFKHEEKGVYGDINSKLRLIPNKKYILTVKFPDGRTYQSKTHIPAATSLTIPDSVGIEVTYVPSGPAEKAQPGYPIEINSPANSFIVITQKNTTKDREILHLDPEAEFKYNNRGPYLRLGSHYGMFFPSDIDSLYDPWIQGLDKPKSEVWMKMRVWLRISFYSKGIGSMFFPLASKFATSEKFSKKIIRPPGNATKKNDPTFLFETSTIRKVGPNGNVLPKEASDAIGFFAGYFSYYRTFMEYPIRQFDLDSVLTATANK